MKKILTSFFISFLAITVLFANDIKTALMPLKSAQILLVEFMQKKDIKGIPKPLISKGYVIIYVEKGLLWQVNQPFKHSIFLNKNGVFSVSNGVKSPLIETNSGQSHKITEIISNLLSGDFENLDLFDIEDIETHAKNWKKRLTPKNEGFKNFLASIEVEGDQHIHHVKIFRKNGDSETIDFKNHQVFFKDELSTKISKEDAKVFS